MGSWFEEGKEVESGEKLKVQVREDEVIADEEGKVVSSEEGGGGELTWISLVQLLDMPWEKSRKMERRGEADLEVRWGFLRGSLKLTWRVMGGEVGRVIQREKG